MNYKNLQGYKNSKQLAIDVYVLVLLLPDKEKFGLISQTTRAAVSIGSNLCEAHAYKGKQKARFLCIALGSCNELEFQLELIAEIYKIETNTLIERIAETKRIINGIINKC